MAEVLGWLSSIVLLGTIISQIRKQWKEGTSKGVTPWLFVGQMCASTGFTIYSALVHNWVFVVTNALLLVSAIVGLSLVIVHRTKGRDGGGDESGGEGSQTGNQTVRGTSPAMWLPFKVFDPQERP